jgi:chromosomal replication initiation ATPase DnaA
LLGSVAIITVSMEIHQQTFFTKIEAVIQGFISKYGVDELIKYLNLYTNEISPSDYNTYHRIQRAVCEVYQIPIADMNATGTANWEYAEAKRIISYLTTVRTKLESKHIATLQGCTPRSVYNHVREVKDQIKNPRTHNRFIKSLQQTIEKLDPSCPNPKDH